MKAYKCDICGEYVNDCYSKDSPAFDIYPAEARRMGIKTDKRIPLNDMCDECYSDIEGYIHRRYARFHGIEVEE